MLERTAFSNNPKLILGVVLGILGGALPIILIDPRFSALIILILLSIIFLILLAKVHLEIPTLLVGLGLSQIINPNKFIGHVSYGYFGVPQGFFISLTDLIIITLLIFLYFFAPTEQAVGFISVRNSFQKKTSRFHCILHCSATLLLCQCEEFLLCQCSIIF